MQRDTGTVCHVTVEEEIKDEALIILKKIRFTFFVQANIENNSFM